jgi:nucleotide-binding universal stress UspA family protein
MYTILVPTDFSKNANNAMHYAMKLAQSLQAKIILLNAYAYPATASNVEYVLEEKEAMEKLVMKHLLKKKKEIEDELPGRVEVDYVPTVLSVSDSLLEYAAAISADLIVMGCKGESDTLEKVFGSVTTSLVRKSHLPVIAVPENYHFKKISRILVSWEKSKFFTKAIADRLQYLNNILGAELTLLRLYGAQEFYNPLTLDSEEKLIKKKLNNISVRSVSDVVMSVPDGIDEAAAAEKADLVVLMPQKHSLLDRIFNGSTTRRLVFHSHTPLLIFPKGIGTKRKYKELAKTA